MLFRMMRSPAYKLSRRQAMIYLLMKPINAFRRDYEYKRLGTLSLLAGIDLQTGDAIPLVSDSHTSKDYVQFLKILDERYPQEIKLESFG
ncbi:hypothetical protein TPHV1_340006 [Treponema phagedenis]|uniref:Transposase n=2 Tax=Treponema phagedenis TaxID=162 RepID=A0A0B7GXW5_TREPH|nr:hypothetical protein TPHV1_340006 [Treponema phagedenis]